MYHLEPLSTDDSVALFVARARESRRDLVVDDDTAALVDEVCRSLDGLPLAIELAAARVRSLSVRDIARRLDDRFALLQDPSSRSPNAAARLAGAIGWSYDLLFPDDQRGLWALSCFAGSAPLAAVEHVLAALEVPADAVVDTLTRLVDRSLVSADSTADGQVRYRLLDSIGAYAADRLDDAGFAETARRAHADWYAQTADWCDTHVRGIDQPTCLAIARAERANVDAALAWCRTNEPGPRGRHRRRTGLDLGGPGRRRGRRRQDPRRRSPPPRPSRHGPTALLLAGWLEASAGNVALAHPGVASNT